MVNINNVIELMSNFLEKSHRKISDFDIYNGKMSYATFKETEKIIGIKFYNPKSINKDIQCRLLLDYVIIPADMWIIKTPFNLIYNQNTRRYEPCLVILVATLEIKGKFTR